MRTLCIVQTRAGRQGERCIVCGEVDPPSTRFTRGHVVHVWSDGRLTHIGCER